MTLLQEALAPRSEQLNADDLIPGPRTIKITGARIVEGDRGGKLITIRFEGDNGKPWKACKTMGRAMVMVWAIVDDADEAKISAQFAGKSVTIYRDPTVDFGNEKGIGGIRISHMSHIDGPKTVKLTVSKGKKAQFVFQPLTADVRQIAPNAAEKWATDHIGFVVGAVDLERLAAIQESGKNAMDKLASQNPELHAKVTAAYAAKLAELSSGDDAFATNDTPDDPFTSAPEGDGAGGEGGQ